MTYVAPKLIAGFLIIAMAASSLGCASRASSVPPVAVPSANYMGYTCQESRAMLRSAMARRDALSSSQNTAATIDVIGVILILLPVATIFGGDKEGRLATAKGEVMALRGAVTMNCRKEAEEKKAQEAYERRQESKATEVY